MISFDISRAKSYNFGNESVSEVYYGSIRIWPHDYSRDYLTIEALESGSITWRDYSMARYILYSLDNGNTWQQLNHADWISSLDAGDKIMFKSDTDYYGFGNYGGFTGNSLHFNVYGNAMSLIYGDDFIGKTDFNYFGASQLGGLFSNSNVVDASNLILPALTMRQVNSAADNNYNGMFYNCYSLTTAPELPATTLADWCYSGMFGNCISLTTAPELPATTLASGCYNLMFDNCSSLNYIKCLATDISATSCTSNWVNGVASTGTFIKDPSMQNWTIGVDGIPSEWVSKNNYKDKYFTIESISNNNDISYTNTTNVFEYSINEGVTWNTWAPNTNVTLNNGDKLLVRGNNPTVDGINGIGTFNATGNFNVVGNVMSLITSNFVNTSKLKNTYQFARLFANNMYLINANDLQLPATTLTTGCYQYMFQRCYYLVTAPELPATTLATTCYRGMFYECYYLTTAPELPATILAPVCYETMFLSCANINYIKCLATDISAEACTSYWVSGVAASGTFVKNASMTNWTTGINGIPQGWTVQDYGTHDYSQDYLTFEALESGTFTWTDSDNSNSIYYSLDDGSTWTQLTSGSSTPSVNTNDKVLFKASGLTVGSNGMGKFSSSGRFNAMGNVMSLQDGDNFANSTSISNNSQFQNLFNGCTNLVNASNLVLPATTLANYCYKAMFGSCASLITTPVLPATTLDQYCYAQMFRDCTSLTTTPELPATTLANNCYRNMFTRCYGLITAAELPATTLDVESYRGMFLNCTSLNYIKCLATDISASGCTNNWVSGVSATGTFVKAASMQNWTIGSTAGIPNGWTVQNAS